jgi:hypothetical protein
MSKTYDSDQGSDVDDMEEPEIQIQVETPDKNDRSIEERLEQVHHHDDEIVNGNSVIAENSLTKGLNTENQIRMSIDDGDLESPIKS